MISFACGQGEHIKDCDFKAWAVVMRTKEAVETIVSTLPVT